MNDRPLSRKPLKTVSSNIRQKQPTTCRRKVLNLHEVIIDFSSSNAGSISANSSFWNIGYASTEDDRENSTPGTIDKSSDQTLDTGTNIECKPVKERPQRGKKQLLTLEEKQAKVAEKEAAKLQAAEKKKLEKEIKKADDLAKKALDKEAKKIQAAAEATKKIEEKAKRNIENAAEKKQNLKRKAALTSASTPSEKKKKKELPPVEKADTANNQSLTS